MTNICVSGESYNSIFSTHELYGCGNLFDLTVLIIILVSLFTPISIPSNIVGSIDWLFIVTCKPFLLKKNIYISIRNYKVWLIYFENNLN